MLTRLDLHYFKCFELLRLPLAELTLLSGTNASGKSSVLQALVLLHQTMYVHEWSTRLMLNGTELKLGTVTDIVDKVNGRQSIEIGITDDEQHYHWTFSGERSEMSMAVECVTIDDVRIEQPASLHYLLPPVEAGNTHSLVNRMRNLTYITAERVGPREVYPLEDRQIATVVEPTGEHAVSVLYWGRDEPVVDTLTLAGGAKTRLRQVEQRMAQFFPGCALSLQQVAQTNAATLSLRTSAETDFHRPIHVGFGLTQVFPIVVAALSASTGDILLIENPEVHLHPAGQALMGQFLAEVSHAGVQVIVETHSDHVLNGIRRAVKAQKLQAEQVAIHFFSSRTSQTAQVVSPFLDKTGNIDYWPDGFFDQFDKDMNHFAGWGD